VFHFCLFCSMCALQLMASKIEVGVSAVTPACNTGVWHRAC